MSLRQQGATVERSIVLTGGWQTSKETAYVQATRARHGTDWYIARDQLGEDGQDAERVAQLARAMTNSHTLAPSTTYPELPHAASRGMRNPLQVHHLLNAAWVKRTPAPRSLDQDVGIDR